MDQKVKSVQNYRKEIFDKIIEYLTTNPFINDVIIARGYNQNIASNEI